MVFQSYALYPTMTVRENITFGMESRGVPKAEQDEAIARVAACCRSNRCSGASPASSRAASASASPWAGRWCAIRSCSCSTSRSPISTPSCASTCAPRSRSCTSRVGKTTVYVTHDQVEAMTLASRIAVMHQGAVQQFDEPRDDLQPAGQHVRRRLHGLAVDELHPGRD